MDSTEYKPGRGAVGLLLASIGVTGVLPHIPYAHWLAWPLMLVSTFAHEMGHGIAGVMVGGSFLKFEMWSNGSGVASISHSGGRIASALISAGGLCGPAVAAAVLFFLARSEKRSRLALWGLVAALLLSIVFVVRGWFGLVFVPVLALTLGLIARFGGAMAARFSMVFLAVQLSVSVFTRGDYLFTPVARTSAGDMPSDVANMAKALLLPYWFWGAVCGAFSVVVLIIGLWVFLRSGSDTDSSASRG
ncbi:M50 family metallopeptidase [Endomicrobium sp. AH-315-J14]|nr:M50 family metallopeptidase [Endomicrobium sp. AH-315-J14]